MRHLSSDQPLCVDLDHTLIRTDALQEALLKLIKKSPLSIGLIFWWYLKGKAYLKTKVFQRISLDCRLLPFHQDVLNWLKTQKNRGRKLILVSATHESQVKKIADHLGIFEEAIGSHGKINLKGEQKAQYLLARYGKKGFDYVGDTSADIPVWKVAKQAIIVNDRIRFLKKIDKIKEISIETVFQKKISFFNKLKKACRVHQYVKNALIFLPLLLGYHEVTLTIFFQAVLGFFAFCLLASSLYILNDLLDLDADRSHDEKKYRPFAAGDLSIGFGCQLLTMLFLSAVALTIFLPHAFQLVMISYAILTIFYSFYLKQLLLVDVFTLAALYTLRILAGLALIQQTLAHWLLLFSMFFFLSLAFVKRYTELHQKVKKTDYTQVAGRSYLSSHLEILGIFGILSGYLSALVLALYVSSDRAIQQYLHPNFLYFVCPLIMYWFSRLWLITYEGKVHQDPVLFALKDQVSYVAFLLLSACFLLSVF